MGKMTEWAKKVSGTRSKRPSTETPKALGARMREEQAQRKTQVKKMAPPLTAQEQAIQLLMARQLQDRTEKLLRKLEAAGMAPQSDGTLNFESSGPDSPKE